MKRIITYTLLMLGSMLSSCQDDEEFKIPTDVAFQMDINRQTSSNGRLSFTEGSLNLASFSFDGSRDEGEDVYFEKEYEQGLFIPFNPNHPIEALKFQIPQGSYSLIEVELGIFDDVTDVGLVLTGKYLNSNGIQYPIRVELASSFAFTSRSKDQSGNSQIILKAGTPATAIVSLDPIKWFEAVPTASLDNAVRVVEEEEDENGEVTEISYILISENLNENIYEIIVSRLEQSTETVFYE